MTLERPAPADGAGGVRDTASSTPLATSTSPTPPGTPAPPGAPAKPRTRGRIIGLDGARGLATLAIAAMHIGGNFTPHAAVTTKIALLGMSLIFFFVLSGFLLFLPHVRRITADPATARQPDVRTYVIHRFARVFPGYLVIFLVVNYVFQVAYIGNPTLQQPGTDQGTGMITDPWQLLANLTLLQTYVPQYALTGINPAWSLTLEFAFYASLPILGLVIFALRRRTGAGPLRLALIAPLTLIVIATLGKLAVPVLSRRTGITDVELINWGDSWLTVFVRSFLVNADNFAFGMLAAVLVVAIERGVVGEKASRWVRPVAIVAMFLSLAVSMVLVAGGSLFGLTLIALASAALILIIIAPLSAGRRSRLAEFLELLPFRFVGKVSLSLYLWHFPVMLMLDRFGWLHGDSVPGMLFNVVLLWAISLTLATITYFGVEEPALNAAKRIKARPR